MTRSTHSALGSLVSLIPAHVASGQLASHVKDHPHPTLTALTSLQAGDYVKVTMYVCTPSDDGKTPEFHAERVWLRVVERDSNGTYWGRLVKQSAFADFLRPGKWIFFETEHVIDVLTKQELQEAPRPAERPVSLVTSEVLRDLCGRFSETLKRDHLDGTSLDVVTGQFTDGVNTIDVTLVVDPVSGSGVVVRWEQREGRSEHCA